MTAVFLPGFVIAWLGLSPPARALGIGFDNLLATGWKVADDMAPAAKLLLGALLLLAFRALGLRRHGASTWFVNLLSGAAAMLAVLLVLPADWSRGFGIGLTGTRLDPALLPIYLGGGAVAGLVFTLLHRKCLARRAPGPQP